LNFIDLIIKKRNRLELSKEEIDFFVKGAVNGEIPDYQLSSMLMAICINSLNYDETSNLTNSMVNSGETWDLSEIKGIKVDKHSTGGVADTTTLILAPLVASCGVPVIKMSGRGLGHTGGTIDKLEAIPNFNTDITYQKALELVNNNNIVIMGQTKNIVPADKILYNLRDVTGTVESIPLIASSIMSKKIAAGCDAVVLDIKCGNGAFMDNIDSAVRLAETMVAIAINFNKKITVVITDMNSPLGMNIGNSFEVIEAIETLKGNSKGRLKDVSIRLGANMLVLGGKCSNVKEAENMLEENIANGKGLQKLRQLIKAQNGNENVIDDYSLFPISKQKKELISEHSGFIYSINTYLVGKASMETGAGRQRLNDEIDYGAGIILHKSIGDKVEKGDIIAEIYAGNTEKCNNAAEILKSAITIGLYKPKINEVIIFELDKLLRRANPYYIEEF